jgi:DNA repair protein RadC
MQSLIIREKATGSQFKEPAKVAKSFSVLSEAAQETYWVLGLDAKNREIFRKCLFTGGMNAGTVDAKIIYRHLLLKGCCSWFGVHNHPSGDPTPSAEDRATHKALKEAGEVIQLKLLDWFIIGDEGRYYSDLEG